MCVVEYAFCKYAPFFILYVRVGHFFYPFKGRYLVLRHVLRGCRWCVVGGGGA